jgi:outer membrane protein OmpA-like peptidoglycan-associated protein
MKKLTLLFITMNLAAVCHAQFGGFFNKVKDETEDKVSNNVSDKVSDKAANDVDKAMDGKTDSTKNKPQSSTSGSTNNNNGNANNSSAKSVSGTSGDFKTYANYDFVPGDTIIFADNFSGDQDGEFPSHWNLDDGQGILNKVGDNEAFCLTQGNWALVSPRMKNASYLSHTFTVEFDYFVKPWAFGTSVVFPKAAQVNDPAIEFNNLGRVSTDNFPKDFSGDFPGNTDNFSNTWHHVAVIFKDNELKCYVDQYRVMVIPDANLTPKSIQFGGIGSLDKPVIFKNVRIASGGSMNIVNKKFTGSKIITHGIRFDVDKATILPESMGTLNMIKNIMDNNPELKFEVDGYTDNTGDAQHNLTLSQQRADAVKTQLVSMGIDASRLTTKGSGANNPISSNDTPEGRANNRRVEFVKMP